MEVLSKNKLDRAFFAELLKLPSFPFYRLVRQDEQHAKKQRRAWFLHGTTPVFSYPEAQQFDVMGYLKEIEACATRLPENPVWIRTLYEHKLDELRMRAALVLAISHGDDQTVTHLSQKLFGHPRQDVQELEREFRCMLEHAQAFYHHTECINAQQFEKMVRAVLDHYRIDGWKVTFSPRPSMKITRGRRARKPVIAIPSHMQISRARAARLLTHEIEVHALRTQNGRRSPLEILHVGLNRYVRTDEGLAIYYQQQLRKEEPWHAPGFWDAWACALTQEGTFADTFATIAQARSQLAAATGEKHPNTIGRDAAWRLCKRVYRGITKTDTYGVGFLRDHLYRSGLLDVREAIDVHGESILPKLFMGNIGLEHLTSLDSIDTRHIQLPTLVSKNIVKTFS